jgi:hypothetical protein
MLYRYSDITCSRFDTWNDSDEGNVQHNYGIAFYSTVCLAHVTDSDCTNVSPGIRVLFMVKALCLLF